MRGNVANGSMQYYVYLMFVHIAVNETEQCRSSSCQQLTNTKLDQLCQIKSLYLCQNLLIPPIGTLHHHPVIKHDTITQFNVCDVDLSNCVRVKLTSVDIGMCIGRPAV